MSKTYAGVDPGKSGAIALLKGDDLEIYPIPYDDEGIQVLALLEILNQADCIYVEKPFIPLNSAKGKFKGVNLGTTGRLEEFGEIKCLAKLSCGEQAKFVVAASWKAKMGLRGKGKEDSINLCKQLFPGVNLKRTARARKDDDNFAEAALLAYFAKKVELDNE